VHGIRAGLYCGEALDRQANRNKAGPALITIMTQSDVASDERVENTRRALIYGNYRTFRDYFGFAKLLNYLFLILLINFILNKSYVSIFQP
jgi:hypothetical protein